MAVRNGALRPAPAATVAYAAQPTKARGHQPHGGIDAATSAPAVTSRSRGILTC
jgi:hypothetical protein